MYSKGTRSESPTNYTSKGRYLYSLEYYNPLVLFIYFCPTVMHSLSSGAMIRAERSIFFFFFFIKNYTGTHGEDLSTVKVP